MFLALLKSAVPGGIAAYRFNHALPSARTHEKSVINIEYIVILSVH
jgi:hypothetical protein